ncbi:MAG: DUF354 domain-containing protein [Solirubrobacteraceae bacterium]
MKIWIDFSNSPHPLLFAPIVRRLHAEGHEVLLTARDNAQTLELARERWPGTEVIGDESPASRIGKGAALTRRVLDLIRWGRRAGPDVALSHNSYAQILAARTIGVPAVTAMDFEHQPANHLAFRLAERVLLPEAVPAEAVERQGAAPRKVVRYPGLKEELYVGDFRPDSQVLERLGVHVRPRVVVVARTPPSRATYHRVENRLFLEALRTVAGQEDVISILLTRHPEQVRLIDSLGLKNVLLPTHAVDSRSLLYAADLLIGGGGTMTREAAILGIPTWTVFAGTVPAVDVWLETTGALSRLQDPSQLQHVAPRPRPPRPPHELRDRAREIEDVFMHTTLEVARRPSGRARGQRRGSTTESRT